MHQRFGSTNVERTLDAFRRHGVMAVLIPSILPPPAPFKIFVLLAGVADISVGRFTTAILIGRGLRYTVEGLLALWYGERAMAFIRDNGSTGGARPGRRSSRSVSSSICSDQRAPR